MGKVTWLLCEVAGQLLHAGDYCLKKGNQRSVGLQLLCSGATIQCSGAAVRSNWADVVSGGAAVLSNLAVM